MVRRSLNTRGNMLGTSDQSLGVFPPGSLPAMQAVSFINMTDAVLVVKIKKTPRTSNARGVSIVGSWGYDLRNDKGINAVAQIA